LDVKEEEVTLVHDPVKFKLGKGKAIRSPKLMKLEKYLPMIPPPKPVVVRSSLVSNWGMMRNDQVGDCTAAGWAHLKLLHTTMQGKPVLMTDDEVIALYVAVTGEEGAAYNPATGDNDNGCAEEDVLKHLRKTGEIGAYCALDGSNLDHLRFCIDAFEGVYVGIELPNTAQSQEIWDVTDTSLSGDAAPGSWGGHCVILVDYDAHANTFGAITWGQSKTLTTAWWLAYGGSQASGGEAHIVMSPDLVAGNGETPSGFDLAALQTDLEALTR
jgi:hypothetical protein